MTRTLAAMLLACAARSERDADLVELDERLARVLADARARWPAVNIEDEPFVRYLAERLGEDDPLAALEAIHAGDLYLACACGVGDPIAIGELERHVLPAVADFVARIDSSAAFADEVRQRVRERLLVARDGAPPKISEYSGRGALGGWIRVVAVRIARDVRRRGGEHVVADGRRAEGVPAPAPDPEIALLKERYGREFNTALRTILVALPQRDRNVLRLHLLDGLSTDAIGALYHVNGSTVRRWLTTCRRRLLDDIRAQLTDKLGLEQSELDSLMGLVRSQLEVSVRRYLGGPTSPR